MVSISDLPVEILLDNLFPYLSAKDLTHLTRTNKLFAVLGTDDTVWKRKLAIDFNFTGEGTARTSGYKTIYRGLWNPKVFVWGETDNGRLGVTKLPRSSVHGVPFPFEVKVPNARIVSIAAGGMSFHALDSDGNVHVWGTLNGHAGALGSDGFSEAGKKATRPLRLELPAPVRSISCGRLHSCVLDKENKIWTFLNWGRPFSFTSHALNNPLSAPLQVECGWMHSALLTTTGEVFVWWPFSGPLAVAISRKFEELDGQGNAKGLATDDGVIPCAPWSTDIEPKRLPSLPPLPQLTPTGDETQRRGAPHLVQIAGFDKHIIGLTNEGHVLKFGSLDTEETASNGRWEYLPLFSDLKSIKENKVFAIANADKDTIEAPTSLQITHVSANFQNFVAYSTGSSSIVLIGNTNTTPDTEPQIKPELQNRSVISVVIGDYHNAALTSDGKLYTWGSFSSGALGLGDPANLPSGSPGGYGNTGQRRREPTPVTVPTQVRFDHGCKSPRDRFCFAVTAAGWHTGALVIDLEPDGDEEVKYEMEGDQESDLNNVPDLDGNRQFESPPILPFRTPGIFRFGHAARGARGGGHGAAGSGAGPSLS